jgi:hypothetical protein
MRTRLVERSPAQSPFFGCIQNSDLEVLTFFSRKGRQTFGEHFGNKSSNSWGYSVSSRLNYIRLRNKQHELHERSFQLIYHCTRHLRRDGWHVDADDELVPFATYILTCGHRTLMMFSDCLLHHLLYSHNCVAVLRLQQTP